jgi:hypothetical protein
VDPRRFVPGRHVDPGIGLSFPENECRRFLRRFFAERHFWYQPDGKTCFKRCRLFFDHSGRFSGEKIPADRFLDLFDGIACNPSPLPGDQAVFGRGLGNILSAVVAGSPSDRQSDADDPADGGIPLSAGLEKGGCSLTACMVPRVTFRVLYRIYWPKKAVFYLWGFFVSFV